MAELSSLGPHYFDTPQSGVPSQTTRPYRWPAGESMPSAGHEPSLRKGKLERERCRERNLSLQSEGSLPPGKVVNQPEASLAWANAHRCRPAGDAWCNAICRVQRRPLSRSKREIPA